MLTLSSQGAQFLLQSVATVVLARLLLPADYGLVAMATAITGMAQAFSDLGLSPATIQQHEISHEQVSTLFWINVGFGLALTLITVSLAPVLAWFYRDPRLFAITMVLSLTFLINGLRVQHDALLRRQMRFRALTVRDITSYVVAVPIAIVMACHGARYWALVALPLILNTTSLLLSWLMVRWIPGLPRRGVRVRSMVKYGGVVAASYFILNIARSTDSILIGWRWGAGPLGLYSRASNLLMLPVRQLGIPASAVAIPAFSRIQNDPDRLARYYLRTVNVMMWVSAPIFGLLFVAAEPVIVLALGARWQEAAPVFQLLAISALGQLLIDTTIWLLVSGGKSLHFLQLVLALAPIMIASYAVGLPFGIKAVALSGSLVMLVAFPGVLKLSFAGTKITLQGVGRSILYPVLTAIAGVLTAWLALEFLLPKKTLLELLVTGVAFALGCAVAFLLPRLREDFLAFWQLITRSRSMRLEELGEV
jgi:PST family polysaccharide transporter